MLYVKVIDSGLNLFVGPFASSSEAEEFKPTIRKKASAFGPYSKVRCEYEIREMSGYFCSPREYWDFGPPGQAHPMPPQMANDMLLDELVEATRNRPVRATRLANPVPVPPAPPLQLQPYQAENLNAPVQAFPQWTYVEETRQWVRTR